MIDLGRPAFHANGVTFFADHASGRTLHYLPDRPRLRKAADGTPEISLLKYRLDPALHDQLGGGSLALTVDLSVDESVLSGLRAKAARSLGLVSATDVRLVPVSADAGSCELIVIDRRTRDEQGGAAPAGAAAQVPGAVPGPAAAPSSELVERLLGATQPALFGTNPATFFAVLSAEGATLIERALRQGGLPIGVVYQLEVPGLRPAIRAQITARWRDVYTFFDERFHGGKLLLAVDIGPTVERLVHDELITITIDDLVPQQERPAVYQQALDQAQRYVLQELFKPTLGQAPPAEQGRSDALATIGTAIKDVFGIISFTFTLRQVKRDELKTFTYTLQAARAEYLTMAPQGTLDLILPEELERAALDRIVRELPPGPPADLQFDVLPATNFTRDGIARVDATITYGGRANLVTLTPAQPVQTLRVPYREPDGMTATVGYTVFFVPGGEGIAGPLTSALQTVSRGAITITPGDLYQLATVDFVAMGVPFERYPAVIVDLDCRDLASAWQSAATFRMTSAQPEVRYTARLDRKGRLMARRRLRYVDARGDETVIDWEDVVPGITVVGDPLPEQVQVPILASARFGTVVRRLIVELRTVADPGRVESRVLTADQPTATWNWTARRDADRRYEYRVTVMTVANEVREGQWLAGPAGKLVVGEAIARLRQVELYFAGRSAAEAGLLAAKVRFAHGSAVTGDEQESLVQDFTKPVAWAYPVNSDADLAYSYQVTYIRRDGTRDERPPVTTSDLLAIVAVP